MSIRSSPRKREPSFLLTCPIPCLARAQPLSSPRRRGPITTKASVIAGPATSPCCGVWVPACAGTTAESHCFTSFSFARTNGLFRLHRRRKLHHFEGGAAHHAIGVAE